MTTLWQKLTDPSPALEQAAERRKARLLAAFLLVIIPLGLLSAIGQLLTVDGFLPTFYGILSGVAFLTGAYFVSRTRFFRYAAVVVVTVPPLVVVVNLLNNPQDGIAFVYIAIGVLLASILFNTRGLLLYALLSSALVLTLPLLSPTLHIGTLAGSIAVTLMITGLVVIANHNRTLIEQDRQQALSRSYGLLEQEMAERQGIEEQLRQSLKESAYSQRLLLGLSMAGQAIQRARTPDQVFQVLGSELQRLGYQAVVLTVTEAPRALRVAYTTFAQAPILTAEKLAGMRVADVRLTLEEGDALTSFIMGGVPAFRRIDAAFLRTALPPKLRPMAATLQKLLPFGEGIIAPYRVEESVDGLLFVIGRSLSETDLAAVSVLANQMGVALGNARLIAAQQQQAEQLQRILDTVPAGIVLLSAAGTILLANPLGSGYLQQLQETDPLGRLTALGNMPLTHLQDQSRNGSGWQEIQGGATRLFESAARPVGAGTENAGWVLVLRDVTEARQRQALQSAQERLATVGQLAAGVAHDFNNIMAVITLYGQMVVQTSALDEKNRQRMETINLQADRAANLISQILDFSRRSVVERTPIDFWPFLKELVELLRRTMPETIAIRLEGPSERHDCLVSADPTRLQQALMNLAFNARDAMPEGGELEIRVSRVIVEEGQRPPLPVLTTGHWLQLVVADTGHGIAPEHLAHVFEPFFTTKPPGAGTGLGLAQVFGIVKQHDGYIDIATTPGEGTAFNIFLPLIDVGQHEEHLAPEPVLDNLLSREATILVVEDDDATREATRDTLASLNYRVLTADNGHNALALLADSVSDIDLVLSDMVMPGMGGRALFEEVRTRYPHIPVVLATGYPLDAEGQALLEQGVVAWLSKPFGVQKLAVTLRNALSTAEARTQDPP